MIVKWKYRIWYFVIFTSWFFVEDFVSSLLLHLIYHSSWDDFKDFSVTPAEKRKVSRPFWIKAIHCFPLRCHKVNQTADTHPYRSLWISGSRPFLCDIPTNPYLSLKLHNVAFLEYFFSRNIFQTLSYCAEVLSTPPLMSDSKNSTSSSAEILASKRFWARLALLTNQRISTISSRSVCFETSYLL